MGVNSVKEVEPALIREEWEQFDRDLAYYGAHYEELLAKHPNEWIAIYGEQMVAAGPDLGRLRRQVQRQGVPIERVLVGHPSSEQEEWVLPL